MPLPAAVGVIVNIISNTIVGIPANISKAAVAIWAAKWSTELPPGTLDDLENNPNKQQIKDQIIDDFKRDYSEYYEINDVCTRAYWDARNPPRVDPLAIDLDGDGIETIGLPTAANPFNPVLFDHNADGVRTGTGWVRPDDAWLALDRNGNGTIDSGRELFGVDTLVQVTQTIPTGGQMVTTTYTRNAFNGFEALGTLDSNGDKVFNSADAQFANVRLWQDTNQDGVSQASELKTLAQQGITAISLTPDNSNINLGNGNTVTGQAAVTRTNGTTTTVGGVGIGTQASNLNLADNPFYRQFNDAIPLTAAAKALPGMGGHLRNGVNLYAANSDAYRLSLAWG